MGFWQNIGDLFTGRDRAKEAEDEARKYREAAASIKNKSTEELQREGRAVAGQAAVGKAAEAKKAAKAASMQTGGNKLQAATNAASAATEAATQGFDASSQAYTQMAGNIDVADKNAQRATLENLAKGKETEAAQQRADKNAMFGRMSTLGAAALGTLSDETKKKVKHTYIPKENRVNKGE